MQIWLIFFKKGTIYELTLILFETTIKVNLDVNYRQCKDKFCFCSNEMLLCRI